MDLKIEVSRFSRVPLLPVLSYMTTVSVTETEVNYSLTSLVGNPLRPSNILIKINNNPGVLNEHNHGLRHVFQIGWDAVDKVGSKKDKNYYLEKTLIRFTVARYDGLKEIVRLQRVYILLR